jgi:acyl carrier protein
MDRQALRTKLLDIFEQETWERPENLADDITIREGLKLDSVDVLSVALRLESELGVTLGSEDFGHIQTVGDLLDTIQSKLAVKSKAA